MSDAYFYIFGVAIMFGLALVMTVLTFKTIQTFFIWLCIFSGFVVWAGLLDLWVLILCLIMELLILINKMKTNKVSV